MIRLTNKKDKAMKDEKQDSVDNQILEVEKIFVANFQNADVLFVKVKNQNAMALKLPNKYLERFKKAINTEN